MKLIYKQIIILTASLFAISGCFVAKTASTDTKADSIHAVFAGTQLDSKGNSQTIAFYFRPNGTYTTKLDQPDWQTRVDGNYKITNQKLRVFPQNSDEKSQEMDIQSRGQNLVYNDIALFKLNITDKIGTLFIGFYRNLETSVIKNGSDAEAILKTSYVFDEKDNFGKDEYRKYEKAGGGFGTIAIKEKAISGTYTIKESLLTLQYNGETTTKSFFLRNSIGNAFVALIDGELFYGFEDRPEEPKKSDLNIGSTDQTDSQIEGLKILRQANLAHGGAKLDSLKTLRMTKNVVRIGSIIETKIIVDLVNKRIRVEDKGKGEFYVGQLDGDNSWLWVKKKKIPLEKNHRNELMKFFSRGVLGLRTDSLKNIVINSAKITDPEKNLKAVNITRDGENINLLFDADNRLISESMTEFEREIISFSEDFRSIEEIIFPFISIKQMDSLVFQETFSTIEVNPLFAESDWGVPSF
jgi:hypothetical protein